MLLIAYYLTQEQVFSNLQEFNPKNPNRRMA